MSTPRRQFQIFNDASGKLPAGKPWFRVANNGDDSTPAEILIYDQIGSNWWSDEGTNAKSFAEALKAIPQNREIVVGINSPGGNVYDGLAIFNQLRMRGAKVTTRIDGVAASIASIIALAGRECRMPRNAMMMIHDPWGMVIGSADEMRQAAEALDKTKESLVGIYVAKTGKPRAEVEHAMSEETWLNGDDAKSWGLCDKLTDEVTFQSSFDLSRFRRVPQAVAGGTPKPGTQQNPAAPKPGAPDTTNPPTMNKAQIIALLKERGIKVADDATDEQLMGLLSQALAQSQTPPPATPQNGTATGDQSAVIVSLQAAVTALTQQRDRERKDRITRTIDQAIIDDRIPSAQRDSWVARCMADETILTDIQNMPQRPPGAEPLGVVALTSESVQDILGAFNRFHRSTESWQRGNSVSMQDISQDSRAKGEFYRAHQARILKVMNTNTVPTGLKRQVIMQEVITDFTRRLQMLRIFSTVFSNVPLLGTNKINVPFLDLDATASTDWDAGTGYAAGNTTTDTREITVGAGATNGGRFYQGMSVTSEELARQPFLDVVALNRLKAEKLAYDIFTDVLGVVTVANYGASVVAKPASAFSSDDIPTLKYACRAWPEMGRTLMLDSEYDSYLLRDTAFKSALNAASDSAVKEGRLYPRVFGFDYVENPNLPGNSENLKGFAVFRSAVLVATAPVPPAEEVRNAGTRYEVVTDPQTGISFEYRSFGDNTLDTAKHFVECSFGWAKGNGNALKRITSV